jgi:hypothetical protein
MNNRLLRRMTRKTGEGDGASDHKPIGLSAKAVSGREAKLR